MRPKTALFKIGPLLKEPSFTSVDARARGVTAATLAYYVAAGELTRIGRGVYRGSDVPEVEDFRWGDLIEAVKRAKDGVVCLMSALAFYGLTEETPRQHWIAIRHGTVHHHPASSKVIRMRNFELGKSMAKTGKVKFPIFDRERTVVDTFRFLSRETAIKALKAALKKKGREKINLVLLQEYSRKLRVDLEPYLLAVTT